MKRFNFFFVGGLLCSAVLFLANSGGRAGAANSGNTGAPGDAPATCVTCHNGSAALAASISVSLIDGNNNMVSAYSPGQTYTVRVQLDGMGSPQGFGFQMIPLKDADDTDIKGFLDAGTNNYKISTISNGRSYAEHDDVSAANVFDVAWKAPATGVGSITFYAGGNRVNGNGQSSGDGAAITTLQVSEASSAAFSPNQLEGKLNISPNPVADLANLRFEAAYAGKYSVAVRDLSGKVVFQNTQQFQTGVNTLRLTASDWTQGVYVVEISEGGKLMVEKLVKL